jgi:hypothetical protein
MQLILKENSLFRPSLSGVSCNGRKVDNTTREEISAWLDALARLRPQQVMIYTIHRDTPLGNNLSKVPVGELNELARRVNELGITTTVSG